MAWGPYSVNKHSFFRSEVLYIYIYIKNHINNRKKDRIIPYIEKESNNAIDDILQVKILRIKN